jgi:D-alanyl-D-alanine carboxypeptidase
VALVLALLPLMALAAPYAAYVMDARTGEVLYETNADTRLHPASLTKMMTLYIAFEAIERGEISLDTKVRISKHAASQAPSRLGLKPGQRIALRYLIRAAAIKSANDAATAIAEAIEGSEPAFARRMTRTAKAIGMTRSTFKNANGLTAEGHLSTAHDMSVLGRRLFYDFPQYYNIFSRRSADAGVAQVSSTNRRFLDSYEGADGIKTGYTIPAGYNLTASAHRGSKRVIATIFGGRSTAHRNEKMAELLDIGFGKAPKKAVEQKPEPPVYMAEDESESGTDDAIALAVATDVVEDMTEGGKTRGVAAGKTVRVAVAVTTSIRPLLRPTAAPADPAALIASAEPPVAEDAIVEAIATASTEVPKGPDFAQTTPIQPETLALAAIPPEPAAAAIPAIEVEETGTTTIATSSAPEADAPLLDTDALVAEALGMTPEDAADGAPDETLLALGTKVPVLRPGSENETPVDEVEIAALPEETLVVEAPAPEPVREEIVLASVDTDTAPATEDLEVVTRVSTSGGRQWGVNVGKYPSRYEAERALLQTALIEMTALEAALRKVAERKGGYEANFVGMTEDMAELACLRLQARALECRVMGPQG